jgi:hypothetical protein
MYARRHVSMNSKPAIESRRPMLITQKVILAFVTLTFVAIILFAATAFGGQIEQLSLNELVVRSDTILMGTCTSSNARWDERTRMILTDSVIKVGAYLRGQGKNSVSVTTPGGVLRDRNLMMSYPGMITFVPGEDVMLFLSTRNGAAQVYGAVSGADHVQEARRLIQPGVER